MRRRPQGLWHDIPGSERRPQGLWHDIPGSERRPRTPRSRKPTTWIRISSRMHEHPDIVGLRSDTTRWAWLVVLLAAKNQPEPGSFRSEEQLRNAVGWRLARSLPALFRAGLLEREPMDESTTRVNVHSWSRWQSTSGIDRTNAERQRRYRERERARSNGVTPGVTAGGGGTVTNGGPPTSRDVNTSPVTAPSSGEAPVTVTEEEGLRARRELAAAIRTATPDLQRRFRATFDRTYGHLYRRPPQAP